jgi:trigger factor
MKTELTDVNETQKTLTIEIPTDIVDAEINRVAKGYTKQAKIPGFRPGKVPATIVKQRFKDQIFHDVMHGLIPRAIEEALTERGIEPVDTPNVKDVDLQEGQPLKFTAAIETVPPFDPGDLSSITLRESRVTITEDAIEQTLQRLRERSATHETIDARPITDGDTVVLALERTTPDGESHQHDGVTVEMGAPGNPPGFDANLVGLEMGGSKTFSIHFPADYASEELRDKDVRYAVTVKEIRRKVLPELDDEFAKDLGEFESLAALRDRIRHDMQHEAEDNAKRELRADLMRQLAQRVSFELPVSLVDRELDRRLEELARQLVAQKIDPRTAGIDWAEFRESQREASRDAVAGALVLDEIARRENITVAAEDVDKEIEQFAARAGRTPAALRAQLEKEGGISRLYTGLRREKAVDLAKSRAKIASVDGNP